MANRPLPSPEVLRQLLRYEPDTGKLFWLPRDVEWFANVRQGADAFCRAWNERFADKEAFTAVKEGRYRQGVILGKVITAHRVVWAIYHGAWAQHSIDHISGDGCDNRIANLRDVSHAGNMKNMKRSCKNVSGVTGVTWRTDRRCWRVRLKADGREILVGSFASLEDAAAASRAAYAKHGFHENHGRG